MAVTMMERDAPIALTGGPTRSFDGDLSGPGGPHSSTWSGARGAESKRGGDG